MIDLIRSVTDSRWFSGDSPFRATVRPGHERLCCITGPNASGKSLVRKILANRCHERGIEYIHTSQEGRTGGHKNIERLFIYGAEDEESTGRNSVKTVLKAIQTGESRSRPFVVMLDEPEIGCSEETQAGLGIRIAESVGGMPNLVGLFVVTHSRPLVARLAAANPTQWHLSDPAPTLAEWLAREIVPADLDELIETAGERWHAVQRIIRRTREQKA